MKAWLFIFFLFCEANVTLCQNTSVIAFMDDQAVYAGELEIFMQKHRAEVIRTFVVKQDVTYDSEFWQTELNGQTPFEYLAQKAMKSLIPYKVQQKLMEEYGMISNWDWQGFLFDYESYCKDRQRAKSGQEVIYGPVNMNLAAYYQHYFTHHKHELTRRWERTYPSSLDLAAFIERKAASATLKWQEDALINLANQLTFF
ncbi:MAG: hypothetical protein AAFO07_05205 [Bacteroidota bacterium]